MDKQLDPHLQISNQIQNINLEYLNAIKSKKKDNVNPKNCQILFLNVIPGISINIATKIIQEYKSIQLLLKSFCKKESQNEKENMLKDIQITEKRKLGKVLSKKIFEYLNV